MKIFEFMSPRDDLSTGYYDPADDRMSRANLGDTRKGPALTLRALNRLKKIQAFQKLEDLKRQDVMGAMYSAPDEGGPGGPPMGF